MNPVVIVIPTYNEVENIQSIIEAVLALPIATDILVVDDNSPDGTAALVQDLSNRYSQVQLALRNKKEGLGPAYVHGFKWALERGYSYVFEMDADFSHPPEALVPMLEILKQNKADLVVGSRYKKGIRVRQWPFVRIMLSVGASLYVRIITGLPVTDPTAGYVGYQSDALRALDLEDIRFKGYAFQIALKFWAWKKGFRIAEFPIIFTDRTKGDSKMNSSIISEAVFGIVAMKWRSIFKN
ncbi:MAG: polyprenol monophosphomannose synthase [Bacteroidetes bacterium]|nr:polyprenol monophosphomannose synthase [Bacteroidota bacterium]MDA0888728.1 polyprenol monophosphomannose synthase [Bacteroidota bacterium]MDA1084273.1 polyprenol monophosphomannose synthase [Bacteroidota bacterium]